VLLDYKKYTIIYDMTHTPTDRCRILSGVLLIAFGCFGAELLCVTGPSMDAFLLPTSLAQTQASSRSSSSVRPRVIVRRSSSSSLSRRTARESARSIRLHGAAPDAPRTIPTTGYVKAACGDKLVLLGEECDDGNTTNGDGCSNACKVETGFACNGGQPSSCWSVCGDGAIASTERCDDGNTRSGDGCTSTCRIEIGYTCAGSPSACYETPYCGDKIIGHAETCDDGNAVSGDGCSASCQTE
jgi:cysteine-rich repeat protein